MEKIKFSIIVPVYNTEQYLKRCFNSILSQTYKNYEVIVVNDGSTDDSLNLIRKYKEFTCINQKNQGLSMARNNGIKKANGDYLIFLDSDDYISSELLEVLAKNIKNEDILRYQSAIINDSDEIINYFENEFENLSGPEAFVKISGCNFVENAVLYVINKDYWVNNKFSFNKNKYHEDFGTIPEVIFKALSVSSINYVGYYYYQRNNSIMNNNYYDKEKKKSFDVLEQGLEEINNIKNIRCDQKYKNIFNHYIVSSIIQKMDVLNFEDKIEYRNQIVDNNLLNLLLSDTIKRKIKKIYYRIKYKL